MNVESVGELKIKMVFVYVLILLDYMVYPTPMGCMCVKDRIYECGDIYGTPLWGMVDVHFVRI
jgi:hypothetical protein